MSRVPYSQLLRLVGRTKLDNCPTVWIFHHLENEVSPKDTQQYARARSEVDRSGFDKERDS
jgi:hypothetical protein